MKKYRIIRTDPGVLDLSQVLDDRGKPILLNGVGAETVVGEQTLNHPLVARYVGAGLHAEEVSLTPVQAPATPVVPAATAPPPAPPLKEPPKKPAAPPPEETKPVEEVMTSADAPSTDKSAKDASKDEEPKVDTTKKATKPSGRSSKRTRGK